jgi:uncharacterized protein YgbK (DUF1537 family)
MNPMFGDRLLLTWYGDDFTGSTDVMEALAKAGIPAALFVDPPTPEQLAHYSGLKAFGVAGISRSLPTEDMEAELRPVFEGFRAHNPRFVHYKICSTFDSSPMVGSIGRAMEIGRSVFGTTVVPVVVGAPVLGRYCVFGNLFARSGLDSEPYRLDRHPTMRHHPVTPMDEADLPRHLGAQTDEFIIGLMNVLDLDAPDAERRFIRTVKVGADAVLFDTLYNAHLRVVGRCLDAWTLDRGSLHSADWPTEDVPLFCVASSGLEYALTANWREQGFLPQPPVFAAEAVSPLLVVSGSASPVTQRQIEWAIENGFAAVALDTECMVDPAETDAALTRGIRDILGALSRGQSVIAHACLGPNDARLERTRSRMASLGIPSGASSQLLGTALGAILHEVWTATDLPRAVVTGGDTSGFVARRLGIEALEMVAPMAPGSPLCRIVAPDSALNGRTIVFKGGQVGKVDLFGGIQRGTVS